MSALELLLLVLGVLALAITIGAGVVVVVNLRRAQANLAKTRAYRREISANRRAIALYRAGDQEAGDRARAEARELHDQAEAMPGPFGSWPHLRRSRE